MSQDLEGGIGGHDDPREPFEDEDRMLGHCIRRSMRVSDEACFDCFHEFRTPYERGECGNRRMNCVAVNIRPTANIRPDQITADDLNALSEGSVRGALGNIVMVAQTTDPDSPTGRTALSEVRLHVSRLPVEELPI